MSKSQISYTLNDLQRLEGGFMKRIYSKEELVPMLNQLNYLLTLSANAGRNIGDYSAMDLGFITKTDELLSWDGRNASNPEAAINRLFTDICTHIDEGNEYNYHGESYNDADGVLSTLVEVGVRGRIRNSVADECREEIKHIGENISRSMDEIQRYNAELRNAFELVAERRLEIESLEETLAKIQDTSKVAVSLPEIIQEQLNEIQTKGRWHIIGVKYLNGVLQKVMIQAKQPIIMHMFNPAVGLDDRIDFGKFRGTIVFDDNRPVVRIYAGEKNLNASAYRHWHPNLDESGFICHGGTEVGEALVTSLTKYELATYMEGIFNLLCTYSQSTPYCQHHYFQEKYHAIIEGNARYGQMKTLAQCGCVSLDTYNMGHLMGTEITRKVSGRTYTVEGVYADRSTIRYSIKRVGGSERPFSLYASEVFENYESTTKEEENGTNDLHTDTDQAEDTIPSGQVTDGDTGVRQGNTDRWGLDSYISDNVTM